MGMVAENAMAFGVNEALKRTFPDEAKDDPKQRPDLVKPFLMVSSLGILIFGPKVRGVQYSHNLLRIRVQSRGAARQLVSLHTLLTSIYVFEIDVTNS
jgi:hypothetical protein